MIEFAQVGHRLGGRVVLTEVTARLGERRIGIIGANGSGKSTLARTINGLVLPAEGTVTVDGLSTRSERRQVRRRVGFMFTDASSQILMPTVAEDLALSLRDQPISAQDKQIRLEQTLAEFDLADYHDHPAQLLSGGQKQLLAFAAVLVRRPEILVCDEPSTLLDLRHLEQLRATLAQVHQQVVLLTHHLDLLDDFDRVLVMDSGRIVHDGEPADAVAAYRQLMGATR